MRPGDKGDMVYQIQDCLASFGYEIEVTGEYDLATEAAVRAFQQAHGLKVDGVCGSETLTYLFGY